MSNAMKYRKENAMLHAVEGGMLTREHNLLRELMRWSDPAEFIASALAIAEDQLEASSKALGFPRPIDAQEEAHRVRDAWYCAVLSLTGARDLTERKE